MPCAVCHRASFFPAWQIAAGHLGWRQGACFLECCGGRRGGGGGLGQAISQTSWKDPSFQRLGQHFPNRIRSGDCRLLEIAPFPPSSPKDAGGQKRDLNGAWMAAIAMLFYMTKISKRPKWHRSCGASSVTSTYSDRENSRVKISAGSGVHFPSSGHGASHASSSCEQGCAEGAPAFWSFLNLEQVQEARSTKPSSCNALGSWMQGLVL
jgi:hypothetical protein